MIHKEGGRPLYSTPMAGLHIAPDFQYSGSCVEIVFKMWNIQPGHRSID
jgi:hypothetical protein